MTSSPKRIGFIGLSKNSWAARSHILYLKDTPNYQITALQNSTQESASAAAAHFSLPNVSTHGNPQSLATTPNIDIVAVSVNVPQHYALIKPALLAKKDIFVEWPLARNLAEAQELTSLAKEAGVRTMIGLQARQSPAIRKVKEIVSSGKLGKILGTTMYGNGMIFGPTIQQNTLYLADIANGANLLTIPFAHAVDALCFALGEVESLSATLANHRPEVALLEGGEYFGVTGEQREIRKVKKSAHDYVSFTGTLLSGVVVDVTFAGGVTRTGRNFYWEINGTEGSVVVEGAAALVGMWDPTVKFVGNEEGAKLEIVPVEKAGNMEEHDYSYNVGKAWDAWAGVGREDGHTVTTFEDALVRHKMIDAIYRSAEKGTRERYL